MDFSMKEVAELETAQSTSAQDQLRELSEVHLALVGGGCGETIL